MNIETLTLDATDDGPAAVELQIEGRFDAHEIELFRTAVDTKLDSGHNHIRIELSAVEFVDSSALAELVRGMKRCREDGGDLVLASPSDPVRVILELTKLDAAFVID